MHYKNGREAKNGDKVMWIQDPKYGASPVVGILYNATAGQDYCNGSLARIGPGDPTPNLKECLHLEDAQKALAAGELLASAPCEISPELPAIRDFLQALSPVGHLHLARR